MTKGLNKTFRKKAIYTLDEALVNFELADRYSAEDLLDSGALGKIKLCVNIIELGKGGLADNALLGFDDDLDCDGHIEYHWTHDHSQVIRVPKYVFVETVDALILAKADCKAICNRGYIRQTVFRQAYKVESNLTPIEIIPAECEDDFSWYNLSFSDWWNFEGMLPRLRFVVYPFKPIKAPSPNLTGQKFDFYQPEVINLKIDNISITEAEILKFKSIKQPHSEELISEFQPEAEVFEGTTNNIKFKESEKFKILMQAIREYWEPTVHEMAQYPSNKEVALYLMKKGYSESLADNAARIIRPSYAKPNATQSEKEDKSAYMSDMVNVLFAVGGELLALDKLDGKDCKAPNKEALEEALKGLGQDTFKDYMVKHGAAILNLNPSKSSKSKQQKKIIKT